MSEKNLPRAEQIREFLIQAFDPDVLEVIDDSAKHAGHAETIRSGGGHFHIRIVSDHFRGDSLIARHRKIYAVLKPLSKSIHALGIEARTPDENSTSI